MGQLCALHKIPTGDADPQATMTPFDPEANISPATRAALHDPWSLPLAHRRRLAAAHLDAQNRWLEVIRAAVEPPAPDRDFPAFLLETPPFADLRARLCAGGPGRPLDTATLDELQHFVDRYREYLRQEGDCLPAWRRNGMI